MLILKSGKHFSMIWIHYCYAIGIKFCAPKDKSYIWFCIHQSQDFIPTWIVALLCLYMKRYKTVILSWYVSWNRLTCCFIIPSINLSVLIFSALQSWILLCVLTASRVFICWLHSAAFTLSSLFYLATDPHRLKHYLNPQLPVGLIVV